MALERFEERLIDIQIPKRGEPKVYVDGPLNGLPHRYPQDASGRAPLCMWFPEDPPESRWTWNDGLLALLGHIRTHLMREGYFLEDERLSGDATWLGLEAPHNREAKQE